LGAYVSQGSADNNELEPMVEAVSSNLGRKPQAVLADRGYINGPMIKQIQAQGIEAYVALSAEALERRPYDLRCEEKRRENPVRYTAPVLVAMAQKLGTAQGRRLYLRRQASVEPVVGITKKALRFEQFLLRGLQKVTLEWNLICVAYNLKRLHKLKKPKPKAATFAKPNGSALSKLLGQLMARFCLTLQ
jgi:Transposase DDE domain